MSENMTNDAPDKEIAGMDLKLDPSVRLITPKNNLLAFASVKIAECFVVDNIKIVAGEKGLFVDMPSIQGADGKYHDIAFPVTAAFRERLNDAILTGYAAAVEKNMEIGDKQREFAEKSPLSDRLAANKEKAAAHNAARPEAGAPRRSTNETEH